MSGALGKENVWAQYGVAFAAIVVVTLLKLAVTPVIQEESPFLIFFAGVMVSAWLGGRGPGLLAVGLAAIAASFFFMTPYYSFAIESAGQAVWILVFVVEGALVAVIVSEIHQARRRAEERTVELQRYQENLREDEERSQRLADEVLEGLALSDNGKILEINKTFTRMFGYTIDELRSMEMTDLVSPEDRQMVARRVSEDQTEAYDTRVLRKDGTSFPAQINSRFADYQGRRVRVTSVLDISERKRAERELHRQRNLYETLLQAQSQVGEGFVIAEGPRISYANEAFCKISGYSERELLELPTFFELFASEERAAFLERFSRRMSGEGGVNHQEITLLHKDGRSVDLEISVEELREDDVVQFVIIARDITERRRTVEELRRSEQSLDAAQRMARMGNFEYDFERDRARWSEELYRIFGWKAEEAAPRYKSFINAAHPDDRTFLRGKVRDALRGEEQNSIDYRIVRPDGEVRFVETLYEVHREGGKLARLIGTVQDVTESRGAERKLRETEARFRTLVEQIPAITYTQATDDAEDSKNVTYMSPQYETISGYTPDQEMYDPEHWSNILHPEDRERVLAEDSRTDETGEPFREEYRVFAKDGRLVWIRDEAVLVRDEDGTPLFWQGVQYDITEQKRVEEELEARAEELAKSNAELERFAYIASHDLQEPLRMVSSYTQLLARRYKGKLDDDADEFIAYAVDGATRMQTLISDLLTYSRVGTQGRELSTTDLSEVFAAARDNLQIAVEESGAAVTSDKLPTVMGDFTQLVQLFQNLIGNAIKFRGEEPPEISVGAERQGREWIFRVQDNGIGIDPRYVERVFIVFQRLHTKEDYPGTGIGLAVCKKIVERHGGRMWIESELGEGSTFCFTLPTTEEDRR